MRAFVTAAVLMPGFLKAQNSTFTMEVLDEGSDPLTSALVQMGIG